MRRAAPLVDIYTTLTQQNRELLLTNCDLDASRAEIQRHNVNLEQLVHERTAQLEHLAEDLRRARDAAEAGSRAKTRFLGTMSHELRTPMNAILGYSRLLRDTGLPAAEQDLARRIVEASDHLLELINGVVEFSRLDEGQIDVQEADFSPLALLTEASKRACAAAAGKGLVCKRDVDPALPETLHGDAGLIARILAQFAENAVKFTQHGGVRLRTRRIGDVEDGRIKLRFLVEDSGIGIAPADQARLFKPFSQLDDRPDRQFEGIGLGLALTQRWAGILGGAVGVDSAPGKGSRFWLELALAAGDGVDSAKNVEPAESAGLAVAAKPATPEAAAVQQPVGELPTDMRARLAQIEMLLNAFDTRAGSVLREAAPQLRRHLGAQVDELERLIAAFDFDQALERLKSFSQQGKTTP
jgi:two-component system, sensor histidine kinase and response regulator